MSIQWATVEEAAEISAVQRQSWQHVYEPQLMTEMLKALPETLHQQLWQKRLRSAHCCTWTLKTPQIAGLLMLEQQAHQGGVELAALYLHPNAIGQGWGRRLFEQAYREIEPSQLYCWVMQDNHHAQGFYRHLGFKFTGEQRQFNFGGRSFSQKKAHLLG